MFSFAFISLAPVHILTLAFHDQASSIDASYRGNQQWENQIILSKDFTGFCNACIHVAEEDDIASRKESWTSHKIRKFHNPTFPLNWHSPFLSHIYTEMQN